MTAATATDAERQALRRCRDRLERVAAARPVYGLSRGFGPLVRYDADPDPLRQADGLLAHLCAGRGAPLPPGVVRTMVWLRLHGMRLGHSGVNPDIWSALAAQWDAGLTPVVPQDGSLNASCDLILLAHAARAAAGEGEVLVGPPAVASGLESAADALGRLGLPAVQWEARSALAFVNGTSASLALALQNYTRLRALVRASAAVTGRLVALLGATTEAYASVRGHPGHRLAAAWTRAAAGDVTIDPDRPLQEPYSLRCAPQILGAVLDQLRLQAEVLATEAGGCTDSPVLVGEELLRGGNFHAAPVALAVEQHAVCAHQVAYLAERQLALVVDPQRNGARPPFLTSRPGRQRTGRGADGGDLTPRGDPTGRLPGVDDAAALEPRQPGPRADGVERGQRVAGHARPGMVDHGFPCLRRPPARPVQPRDGGTGGRGDGEPVWDWLAEAIPVPTHDRPLAAEFAAIASVVEDRFVQPLTDVVYALPWRAPR